MARTRMVTRTINVTTITALCMDITNATPCTKLLELTGETYTKDKALKVAQKTYDTDTLKVVAITDMNTHEECYGMLETDFLQVSKKLDPQTRKMLEAEETE